MLPDMRTKQTSAASIKTAAISKWHWPPRSLLET